MSFIKVVCNNGLFDVFECLIRGINELKLILI